MIELISESRLKEIASLNIWDAIYWPGVRKDESIPGFEGTIFSRAATVFVINHFGFTNLYSCSWVDLKRQSRYDCCTISLEDVFNKMKPEVQKRMLYNWDLLQ